uniref:Phospholipase A2-like central domain-containing protein n=1 Tax=Amphiprion percula TaxID=161767 RepID=A0A3P8SBS0_AMPPE
MFPLCLTVLTNRALWLLRTMIVCTVPDMLDYADYGCYCRLGGSGTPVDGLDRPESIFSNLNLRRKLYHDG